MTADTLVLLERLIGFDTTSHRSNLDLIAFVRDYLSGRGVAVELFTDSAQGKANLFATIGPTERGGVLLSGHTDVVPVAGQSWSSDPFVLRRKDGRLYGRGAADMKSFLAVVLALVPEMLAVPLTVPVHLSFSYDEEVGCLGVRSLIAALQGRSTRPVACIIGEPTEMKVAVAHKGKHAMRCEVHGQECHSAYIDRGVNAVEYAAELVARLRAMAARRRDEGPFDPNFDPPYTTIHTGAIRGGSALNIVPRHCSFEFEVRHLPADSPAEVFAELQQFAQSLLPQMERVSSESGFSWHEISAYPGLAAQAPWLSKLAMELSGANTVGTIAFGTEGGLFQESGIPTVVCGPGSIEQAHKPDEFIAEDQLQHCLKFTHRLIEHLRDGRPLVPAAEV